ncbi:MAG: hypothetical protein KKF50_04770 [Nanoarchaeota archaeon]|nr:hypothetical protein [Nanoarchaeota archaeon]
MSVLILKGDKNKAKENFGEIFKKFNVAFYVLQGKSKKQESLIAWC